VDKYGVSRALRPQRIQSTLLIKHFEGLQPTTVITPKYYAVLYVQSPGRSTVVILYSEGLHDITMVLLQDLAVVCVHFQLRPQEAVYTQKDARRTLWTL
jgi:hypothetical protein